MIDPETEYLMIRAKDEAVLAIRAGHPAAADAHHGLAVLYSTRAVTDLVAGRSQPTQPPSPAERTSRAQALGALLTAHAFAPAR